MERPGRRLTGCCIDIVGTVKAAAPLVIMKNRKDPKELLPGDIQAMLLSAAELEGRVKILVLTMKSLDDDYAALLRQP